MACPHVAGTIALMLAAVALTPTQVETVLETTAKDGGAIGVDNYYGHGRINAVAAVAQALVDFYRLCQCT